MRRDQRPETKKQGLSLALLLLLSPCALFRLRPLAARPWSIFSAAFYFSFGPAEASGEARPSPCSFRPFPCSWECRKARPSSCSCSLFSSMSSEEMNRKRKEKKRKPNCSADSRLMWSLRGTQPMGHMTHMAKQSLPSTPLKPGVNKVPEQEAQCIELQECPHTNNVCNFRGCCLSRKQTEAGERFPPWS